jgi:hypothetical protein
VRFGLQVYAERFLELFLDVAAQAVAHFVLQTAVWQLSATLMRFLFLVITCLIVASAICVVWDGSDLHALIHLAAIRSKLVAHSFTPKP